MSETKSPAKKSKKRRPRFTTPSGLPLKRVYAEEKLGGWNPQGAPWHPAGKSFDLDDDQLYSGDFALALCGRGEEARRESGEAFRHGTKRYPEGIYRSRHIHLSRSASDAHRHRYFRVVPRRAAQVEHDFDFGLSHS